MGKFESISHEGYSTTGKVYCVFNKILQEVKESINVRFDENTIGVRNVNEDDLPLSLVYIASNTQNQQPQSPSIKSKLKCQEIRNRSQAIQMSKLSMTSEGIKPYHLSKILFIPLHLYMKLSQKKLMKQSLMKARLKSCKRNFFNL